MGWLAARAFTRFDFPGSTSTLGLSINDLGEIASSFNDAAGLTHAFVKSGATFAQFDFPGGHNTIAFGINNGDEVVGVFTNAAGASHAFTRQRGIFTQIDPPGAANSVAFGVNVLGFIVGSFATQQATATDSLTRTAVSLSLIFPEPHRPTAMALSSRRDRGRLF